MPFVQRIARLSLAVAVAAAITTATVAAPAIAGASGLPRVHVYTDGGKPIADEPKTSAGMLIRGAGGYRGRIGIELRGSSSRSFAKKSYALETRSHGSEGRNVALLGMPSENDWILNGAHSDPTLIRDALAYATARRLGRWAPRTRHVELYLNRRYQGVYVLAEQLKLDRARVAVPRAQISGGYLVELSSTPFAGGFRSAVSDRFYGHKDPKSRQLKRDEAAWIAAYVTAAERSLAARDGSWRALVDERAAADHLLLQELFKNYDAFLRSTFLAKGTDQPLAFGPIWDFDRAMGLDLTGGPVDEQGWITAGRPWAGDLLADAAFTDRLAARWRELRQGDLLAGMLRDLDRHQRTLRAAHIRNAARWPASRAPTHAAQMRRLRAWLIDRTRWIDRNIEALGATITRSAP